ncbi:MAG TPA: hypothetical protein VHC49_04990 [Mycobacteriales bacterium]|nr:hypothetical protein [Mycobacteriales bacterium]
MTAVEEGMERLAQGWRTFRAMPAQQLGLRGAFFALGIAALAIPIPYWPSVPGVLAVFGFLILLVATAAPSGIAPSVVLGFAAVEWIIGYGWRDDPNHYLTVALAAVLYLVHTTGALCAAMPPTARCERVLLVRWFTTSGLVLLGFAVVVAIVYGIGQLPGSLPLELAGFLGVLAVVAVPVWLARRIER